MSARSAATRRGIQRFEGYAYDPNVPNYLAPTKPTENWGRLTEPEKAKLLALQVKLANLQRSRVGVVQAAYAHAAGHYSHLASVMEQQLLVSGELPPVTGVEPAGAHLSSTGTGEDPNPAPTSPSTAGLLSGRIRWCRATAAWNRETARYIAGEQYENVVFPRVGRIELVSPLTDVEVLEIHVQDVCKEVDDLGTSQDPFEVSGRYQNDRADMFPVDLATASSSYVAHAREAMLQRLSEVQVALDDFLDLGNPEGVGRRFASSIARYKAEAVGLRNLDPCRSDQVVAMSFFLNGCVGEGTMLEIEPPAPPRSFLE